jgi:hypothetical protein
MEVVPPGPTPTLIQEIERNWSLVGIGYRGGIVNFEENELDYGERWVASWGRTRPL